MTSTLFSPTANHFRILVAACLSVIVLVKAVESQDEPTNEQLRAFVERLGSPTPTPLSITDEMIVARLAAGASAAHRQQLLQLMDKTTLKSTQMYSALESLRFKLMMENDRNDKDRLACGLVKEIGIRSFAQIPASKALPLDKLVDGAINPLLQRCYKELDQRLDQAAKEYLKPNLTREALTKFTQLTFDPSDRGWSNQAAQYLQKSFLDNKLTVDQKVDFVIAVQWKLGQRLANNKDTLKDIGIQSTVVSDHEEQSSKCVALLSAIKTEAKRRYELGLAVNNANKSLVKEVAKVQKSVNEIKQTVNDVKTEQEKLLKVVAENQLSFHALQIACYEQLPIKTKIALVDTLPITTAERAKEKESLKQSQLANDRVELLNSIERYMDCGSIAIRALSKVGVDTSQLHPFVEKVTSATKVVVAAAKGDIFGVISNFASFLFGGGEDPEEQRHRELLKRFDGLDRKLDSIMESQKEILKELIEVRIQLAQVEDRLHQHLDQIELKLDTIRLEVLANRSLLVSLALQPLKDGETFIAYANRNVDVDRLEFYRQNSMEFAKSVSGLMRMTLVKDGVSRFEDALFMLYSPQSDPAVKEIDIKERVDLLRQCIDPLFDEFDRFASCQKFLSIPSQLPLLLHAAENIRQAEAKSVTVIKSSDPAKQIPSDQFGRLLNHHMVTRVAKCVLALRPYLIAVDPQTKVALTYDYLQKKAGAQSVRVLREKAVMLLENTLTLVEMAICQQNLMSGDLMLPWLTHKLCQGDAVVYRCALGNPVLASNIAMYALSSQFKANNGSMLQYKIALAGKDPEFLRSLFGSPLDRSVRQRNSLSAISATCAISEFVGATLGNGGMSAMVRVTTCNTATSGLDFKYDEENNVWLVTLGPFDRPLQVAMPSAESLVSGDLRSSANLLDLKKLRNDLLIQLTELRIAESMSTEERAAAIFFALQHRR